MPIGTGTGTHFETLFDYEVEQFVKPPQGDEGMEIKPPTQNEIDMERDFQNLEGIPVSDRYGRGADLEGPLDDTEFSVVDSKFSEGTDVGNLLFGTGKYEGKRFQTWPERAIRGTAEAVRKLATGEVDPTSPEGVEAAFEVVSSMVFGPTMFTKLPANSVGSFAGITSKTVNKGKLKEAQTLESLGKSQDEIWNKTGFMRADDDRWVYEIPEPTKSNLAPLAKWKEEQTLGDVLNHPELYKAYPEIRDFPVILDKSLGNNYGAASNTYIKINPDKINSADTMMRVLTHEIQHILQRYERRESTGSNPSTAADYALAALRRREAGVERGSPEHKEILSLLRDIEKNKKDFGLYLYRRNLGETEANLSMRRYETQNYSQNPRHLQEYLEYKGIFEKPLRIPDIESARASAKN